MLSIISTYITGSMAISIAKQTVLRESLTFSSMHVYVLELDAGMLMRIGVIGAITARTQSVIQDNV